MIEFKNVFKKYKNTNVLSNISFKIETGNIVCLIGESGCGKTTTLKMINRLINPTKGHILIDGEDINNKNVIELRRNIGYVIQQTGLFPHLSIRENIDLIARLKKMPEEEINNKTKEMMDMVGLDMSYLDRYPTELSGGQQQRVAIARALAAKPVLILADEPTGNLDSANSKEILELLKLSQLRYHQTIVLVTHDARIAAYADRIYRLEDGKIMGDHDD